jgi:hypothetical protein
VHLYSAPTHCGLVPNGVARSADRHVWSVPTRWSPGRPAQPWCWSPRWPNGTCHGSAECVVLLGMDFLDLDGGIMRSGEAQLATGATTALDFPLEQDASGIQVVASVPVRIEASVLHHGSAGPWERQPVACQPISRSIRNREPETP